MPSLDEILGAGGDADDEAADDAVDEHVPPLQEEGHDHREAIRVAYHYLREQGEASKRDITSFGIRRRIPRKTRQQWAGDYSWLDEFDSNVAPWLADLPGVTAPPSDELSAIWKYDAEAGVD